MRKFLRLLTHSLTSDTAKDTYLIFSGNIFTSFLAFLYTIFLARAFSPDNLGVFSSITAFILLAGDVLDLGITTSLSRFYPEIKRKEGEAHADFFINNTFKFQLYISLAMVIFIIILSPFLSGILLQSASFSSLYVLAGIGVLTTVIAAFISAALSAQKRFLPVVLVSSSSTLVKLLLVLLLFYSGRFSLELVTASFVVAPLAAILLGLNFLRLSIIGDKFSLSLLKKLLSYSTFIAFARVFSAVSSRFDALMLIPLSSTYEAGIYSAAYKIIFTYILLSGSFSMVIAPRLSSFPTIGKSIPYLKKVILGVFLILLTMVFMYIVAPVFVPFILGDNYYQSIPVFRALLLPAALFVSTIPSVNFLLYVAKKPQISAFNTIVSLLIIFFGNLYFIPHYGRLGPVFTLTLAYGFTVISSSLFTFYYLKHG